MVLHHDGILEKGKERCYVKLEKRRDGIGGSVRIVHGRDVLLWPKHALSLLAWLQQEQALLEQWAKEEEEDEHRRAD